MRLGHQYPSEQAGRPLRRRRLSGARLALRVASIVGLILLIVALGTVLVVVTGPTEFGLIRERVAGLIRDGLGPGYTVDVRRAVLDVDPVLGFNVRVDDISVRDSNQTVVALVPSTRFAVDPVSLIGLRAVVTQIELSNPDISFVRSSDGIYVGNAATARGERGEAAPLPDDSPDGLADGGFPEILAALYQMDRGIEPNLEEAIRRGFKRFAVVNAAVTVYDPADGSQRRFAGTDLNLSVDAATAGVSATFSSSGFGGRWNASMERVRDSTSGSHVMSMEFSQLMLADVLPQLGSDEGLLTADVPLYGRANIRLKADGSIEDATARIDLGAGILRFGEERERVLLDEATVKLRWDVPNRELRLEPSTFFFGETRGVVAGRVYPQGDAADRRYAFAFESPGAVLAPRDSGEPPMIAQRIAISGIADLKAKVINFDNAVIVAQDAAVAAAGSIGLEGPTPSLVVAATFSPMSAGALKQMWVPLIAPGARRWVMEHIKDGRLVSGRYEAAIPPGVLWTGKRPQLPDDAMRLDMRVEDVAFTTFGALPPIEKASGNIVVTGSSAGIDIESGEIRVPSGTVTVINGAYAVPNMSERPAQGLIELQLAGSAQALGQIGDSEPLRGLKRINLTPGDLSGSGTANVSVRLPMRPGLTEGDVDWRVVVNTQDVASKAPVEGRTFSEADVTLTITPNDVSIYGNARIDGAVADVSMSIPIGQGAASESDRRVRLLLDDEARKRFGVGLDNVLSGSIAALVSDTPNGDGQHYDLDLTRARVILPGLGWSKGVGVPARMVFDVRPDNDGHSVDNIVLEGDGFGFSGSARLDESYNLVSADIGRMSLRPDDSISMKLTRGSTGYAITARGSSFDLRGVRSHVRDRNSQAGGFPDIAVDARIDRIIGFNGEDHRRLADHGLGRRLDAEDRVLRQARRRGHLAELRRRPGRHDAARRGRRCPPADALHRPLHAHVGRRGAALGPGRPRRADDRLAGSRCLRRAERAGDGARGGDAGAEQRVQSRARPLRQGRGAVPAHGQCRRHRGRAGRRGIGRRDVLRALRPRLDADHHDRHLSAGICVQQPLRADPDSWPRARRRHARGPHRRHLQDRRPDRTAAGVLQSAVGGSARNVPEDLRVPAPDAVAGVRSSWRRPRSPSPARASCARATASGCRRY